MEQKFFMHRIKHTAGDNGGTWDKGIEVHPDYNTALGAYYAYLGNYGYGRAQAAGVDYVSCEVSDMSGGRLMADTWIKPEETAE